MNEDTKVTERTINHPVEDVLGIEPGTTLVETNSTEMTELVEIDSYDDKDREIEHQIERIYQEAMGAFEVQLDITETVEGRFAARNAEVATAFLNTALNAVKEKSNIKQHKDKMLVSTMQAKTPNSVHQNIVLDHKSLIQMLKNAKE